MAYNFVLMNIYALSGLINSVIALTLGLFVLIKNFSSKINRIFFLLIFVFTFWSLSYTFWQLSETYSSALFFTHLLSLGSIYIPITFLHWVLTLLNKSKQNFLLFIGYLTSFIISLFCFTPLIVKNIHPILIFQWWPSAGILYTFYIIFLYIGLSGYGLVELLKSYKKTTGQKKEQLKFVILGSILGLTVGFTNFPLWYGIKILPIGNLFISIFAIIFFYAIYKYRFFEVRLVVRSIIVYLFSVGISLCCVFIFIDLFQNILSYYLELLLAFLFGMILFPFLLKTIRNITDQILFQKEYSREALIKDLGKTINETLDLRILSEKVCSTLKKVMKIKFTNIVYKPVENGEIKKILDSLAQYSDGEVPQFVRDDLERKISGGDNKSESLVNSMRKMDAQVIIPLGPENKHEGLLILGEKLSGDAYNASDIQIIEALQYQINTALEKARLYDEVKNFSKSLEQEVKKATHELKITNEKLMIANQRLSDLDQMKKDFIPLASKELQTPLIAIRNYLWMLKNGEAKGNKRKEIDKISTTADKLIKMLTEIK